LLNVLGLFVLLLFFGVDVFRKIWGNTRILFFFFFYCFLMKTPLGFFLSFFLQLQHQRLQQNNNQPHKPVNHLPDFE